jgi:capsular polysaccharide biosynthesis protein
MHLVGEVRAVRPDLPGVRYTELAPAGRSVARPPPFLLGPGNGGLLWDIFGEIETPSVGCYTFADVTVAPTGIPIRDGIAFYGESFMQPECHVEHLAARLNREDLPVRAVPGPLAVLCGPGHETWGHWLTDFMPALWVLRQAGQDLSTLRYLVPWDMRDFAPRLLFLAGIEPAQCVTYNYWQEILRTDLLLLPTFLRAGNRFAPCFADATSWWTGVVRTASGAATADGPRLFVSRAQAPRERVLQNRDVIESMARDAGYRVVRPEALSIAAQIGLYAGARVIVGEYGSGLHGSVFSPAGTIVCGLRGTAPHPGFVQSGIATALRQEAAYVFGTTEGEVTQRFSVEPRLFRRALELLEVVLF